MLEQVLIWVFWISVAVGCYVYFIYPLILAALAAILGRQDKFPDLSDDDLPSVALMIPCYNEERDIEAKLLNSMELDYPKDRLRIIVLNDGSSDSTVEIARRFFMSHPEAYITLLDYKENRGKSAALYQGISWLKENHPEIEVLALTDANAMWAKDALRKIIAPFSDPKVGSASGLLRYTVREDDPAGRMEGLYWRYETFLKRMSSRLGTLPGANGSIFALRLSAYHPLSKTRGDDYELPVMGIINGYKAILVEDADSREAPSPSFSSEYRRKLRITGQMIPSGLMLFWKALGRGRILIAFQLLSHKLLRYSIPFFQILLLVSSLLLWDAALFYRFAFIAQALFYTLAFTGYMIERAGSRPPRAFQIPLYFTMVNIASLMSIIRVTAGREIRWERNR